MLDERQSTSSPDGLEAFMHSLGALESGNNYDAVGPYTGSTYGRARGRWQIMEKIYPAWAREAGVDPNDYSPAAQERVARHKMTQYYRTYGSWDLVAVAWFAGPGRAAQAKRSGISSVGGLKDMLGTSVTGYVSKVLGGMSGQRDPGTAKAGRDMPRNTKIATTAPISQRTDIPTAMRTAMAGPLGRQSTIAPIEAAPGTVLTEQQQDTRNDQINQDTMGNILSTISEAAKGRGGQVLDLKGFLGLPQSMQQPTVQGLPAPAVAAEAPEPSQPEATPAQNPSGGPMAPPPKHDGFAGLKAPVQANAQRLMAQFPGLTFTSGYRDAARNAAAGGVKTSKHISGEATDFDGDPAEMERAAEWAKANGAKKAFVHRDGDGEGVHLHIEW